MIFGETSIGKKSGPNINNDRVVPFSNKRYNNEKVVKKPNLKERIRTRLEATKKVIVEPTEKSPKIKVSVGDNSVRKDANLTKVVEAASNTAGKKKGKLTSITVKLPNTLTTKKKADPIDLLTPEEEQDVSQYLANILTSPIAKKKTRLAVLAGDSNTALTKEQKKEQEEQEIAKLRKQLHAKLMAAAEEEGVDMVFDVDAALSNLKSSKKKKKKDYSKILKKEKAVDTVDTVDTVKIPQTLVLAEDQDEKNKSYVEIDLPKKKKKKSRIIAQRKLGTQYVSIVPNSIPDKLDAKSLASNVVDIPEKEIVEFRKSTNSLTRKYIDFMRRDILPHLIALDSAIDYTQALMQDGLSRDDLTTDDSLLITLRWMLHRKATEFFGETLNCKMSGDHFDQVISELYKTDLLKCATYSSETVGVIRKKESSLGVVSKKSNRNSDAKRRKNVEET